MAMDSLGVMVSVLVSVGAVIFPYAVIALVFLVDRDEEDDDGDCDR